MSIKDYLQKIKLIYKTSKDQLYSQEIGLKISGDLYIVLIIILVGTTSFGLGKLSAYEKNKKPIEIIKTEHILLNDNKKNTTSSEKSGGEVVASKTGTKYYYPWCSGVSRIKEENKLWFETIDQARSVGLLPASNCVGLK